MREKLCLAVIQDLLQKAGRERRQHREDYLRETNGSTMAQEVREKYIDELGSLEVALSALAAMLFPGGMLEKTFFFKFQKTAMLEELAAFCAFHAAQIGYHPSRALTDAEANKVDQMYMLVHHFRNILQDDWWNGVASGGRVTRASRLAFRYASGLTSQRLVDLRTLK